MFKDREDKRFIKIFKEGSLTESIQILLDTETGVNYIHLNAGYGISLTPLLDSDGKVLVSSHVETIAILSKEIGQIRLKKDNN